MQKNAYVLSWLEKCRLVKLNQIGEAGEEDDKEGERRDEENPDIVSVNCEQQKPAESTLKNNSCEQQFHTHTNTQP